MHYIQYISRKLQINAVLQINLEAVQRFRKIIAVSDISVDIRHCRICVQLYWLAQVSSKIKMRLRL